MSFWLIIRDCSRKPWFVCALVFAWKIALFALTTQPVPANDSYFYDGPVVNYLVNGSYVNPSLALALPISGTEVFSAYPPLYQSVLFAWMSCFGTSAPSAMALHVVLFGLYVVVLLAIFRRLQTPAWCVNLAGLYLLSITFHDRPDSLAQLLGMLAVYAWVRARESSGGVNPPRLRPAWAWLTTALVVLTLCTSLQIGGICFTWIWIASGARCLAAKEKWAALPMAATVLVPAALIALVKFGFPHLWAGFLEHARQTPSLTGWRVPRVEELLKLARTVPGVLTAAAMLLWLVRRVRGGGLHSLANSLGGTLFVSGLAVVLALLGGCLFVLTANMVQIANYLQPLIVGCFLALTPALSAQRVRSRIVPTLFVAMALLSSIRAVGMSIWGVACAADVGYPAAMRLVRVELNKCPPRSTVAVSAAFLYEAAQHREIRAIHSDWLDEARSGGTNSFADVLAARKPAKLILSQFDYYRRYEEVLGQLKSRPELVEFQVVNAARIPPPDASKVMQRVVQHISWAPVVVTFSWK